jgi:restriction system protein
MSYNNDRQDKFFGMFPESYIEKMTPTEFELKVKAHIAELGQSLDKFEVTHNVSVKAHDGTYQIDVLATYEALGAKMTVVVECKMYTSPVPREKVQVLHDKLRSIGAQKGMLYSTAGFQKGAIHYATNHGIALVRMLPGAIVRFSNSAGGINKLIASRLVPQFLAECRYDDNIAYVEDGRMTGLKNYLMT